MKKLVLLLIFIIVALYSLIKTDLNKTILLISNRLIYEDN